MLEGGDVFRIGDFAKLTRVSVKTLHHYDDIGLFKLRQTDEATGYRLYSFEQLPRLNRILALKDLGFTLGQVADILDEGLSPGELEGMLRLAKSGTRGGDGRAAQRAGRAATIWQRNR